MDYSKKSKEELIEELKFLRKKESTVSLVLDNINEVIFHLSFDEKENKHIEYISPHIERVLGLTTAEYIEDNKKGKILEHFHPEDVERVKKESKKITPNQKEFAFTYRFFNKLLDKYVWIEETIIATYKKNGKKLAIYGTAKDVTEKVERENQLTFLLDNVDECIYNVKFTAKGKELNFVSPQIKNLTGLTKKEFIDEGLSGKLIKRIHPNDIDSIKKNISNGLYRDHKKRINSKFRLKPKGSKKYLWIEETLNATYDTKGNLIETTTVLRDITKHKVIEQHLKENEEKYRTVFTKNLAGVFITENNKIVDCNNSFAKIFGYRSRVELIGKKIESLYHSKKERKQYLIDLNEKGFLTNYRIRNKNKKGETIWISANVTLKEKGRIEGTLVSITDQVRTEEKLKNSEKNYKDLTEFSPYGIFVHIDGKIIYANQEAYKIWGLSRSEKKNLKIKDFILPENTKQAEERTRRALLGDNLPFKEFKIRKPFTNTFIYVEVKPTLFEFEGKKAVQVVFNDITVEKELSKEKLRATIAEESNKILQTEIKERKRIEKQLIENQQYTRSIINSSLDIICASDEDGNIIEFNSAAEYAFGYKEEEVLEKSVKLIYASKKEYLEVSKQLKGAGIFIGEVKNIRKNGDEFTSFLSASVLYNEEGKQIGTMGVSRDITEIKEAEQQLIESEERYRDLFENATDLIQSIDVKGNILYVNDAWKKVVGYTDEELENKNIFEIIHPDNINKYEKLFAEIIKNKKGTANKVSYELRTKQGKKISVEGNVSVKFKNDKIDSTRAILRDITGEIWENTKQNVYNNVAKIITEKVNPEEIYEGVRAELGKVMNTDIFVISYLLNKDLITFPYYYDKIKGKGRVDKLDRVKGVGINEYFIKEKSPKLLKRKGLDKVIKGGGYELMGQKCLAFVGVPLKIKNKTVGVLSVQSYTNENEFSDKTVEILEFISGALALAVQRKVDENIIFEQSARLKSIIESSTHLFWTYDEEKGVTSSNKNFVKYIKTAYDKKAEIGNQNHSKLRFALKGQHSYWDEKYAKAFKGKSQHFISKKKNKKGGDIVKEVFLNPIYNSEGEVTEISGIAHDITAKTISDQKLKDSLKEKEVLLKEVHHRVKNNLQVISSILNLQSSYVKDTNTLNILRESQNRIKSMAFIHESLYQTSDFSKINFSEYITSLSKNLVHSYGILDNLVELRLSVGNVSLNLDLSIPCGLIINELVSNSLKYAFTNRKKGTIKIDLFEKKGGVHLIVQDNGLGLPKKVNFRETDSLGLQLVMTLVEQINGSIELDNKKGAKFTIIFKKE